MVNRERVRELAQLIEAGLDRQEPARPALRVVRNEPERTWLRPHDRDMRYQLIRDIARLHGLQWLVRRETADVDGIIERLDDAALVGLHTTLRRAQDCILDGIGFDDAGIL